MNYKYKLDKNRNRVKSCPCGKKNNNKFVPFIGFENKGHCFSCINTFFPEQDFNEFKNYKPSFDYKPTQISYHDSELVSKSGRNFKNNNFIQFVKKLVGVDETKKVIEKYLIGTSKKWNGATVFWQIDNFQRIRHGKIMLYNPITGKRMYRNEIEKKHPYFSSVRAELKIKDFHLKQCLFGLHLINETSKKTIGIVEGEKSAILMSIFKPEYTWLATGSKGGFKYEYLKPIKEYKIIGFPDKSEYHFWLEKAIELNQIGFDIKINNWLEKTDYPKGTDFADIYIQEKRNITTNFTNIENEKIDVKIIQTSTEKMIKKMIEKNPYLTQLIKVFQLTDNNGIDIKV